MEAIITIVFYLLVIGAVVYKIKKKGSIAGAGIDRKPTQIPGMTKESSSMPHEHRKPGRYDTFNRKGLFNDSGTMPHKHETQKYTSQSDASKLPKGYILLNGEPVRVADLEGK